MTSLFGGIYKNKKVLVTGHTGFKGSWLALWLSRLGARVTGFSLPAPSDPSHWDLLNTNIESIIGDIRDAEMLQSAVDHCQPDIVFHLAAQPIVRTSYADPSGTYSSNVMGTLNVCEVCRSVKSVRALVAITTDKVYRNREWFWGYREVDELGGHDPYSSSKACADILLSSYRDSFLAPAKLGSTHNLLLAVTRAGNVIGGGDWARDRLIPDIARAVSRKEPLVIRSPNSTRPWQHVLECLSGYLLVGQRLLEGRRECGTAFNFGTPAEDVLSVENVVKALCAAWPEVTYRVEVPDNPPHEAGALMLDCAKSRSMLGWEPVWSLATTFSKTASWYRQYYASSTLRSLDDLESYTTDGTTRGAIWTR